MNSLRITLQRLQKSICHFGLALLILAGVLGLNGNTSLLYAQISELCGNGVDDDGDTLIDCDDPDCRFPLFDGGIYGNSRSWEVALGDLDGDGDLDAWVANEANQPNRVWINDGLGNYTDSGQALGNSISSDGALGDLDGDGDLDAWVANAGPNRIWINDGNGNFTDSGQALGSSQSNAAALGDLDGDGDLDAWVANGSTQPNRVWINDGLGNFADSGQGVGVGGGWEVALGDLDGDGDLDVWNGDRVWINDGNGNFTDSGQSLGNSLSKGVALGDLDGDGDLDAWVASYNSNPNSVWLNDGLGNFTDSGQALGNSSSTDVTLGDLDGDGDLDAWVANGFAPSAGQPNRVYINDGNGNYTDSGQSLGNSNSHGVALGDLDDDGDLDAWVANRINWPASSNQPNRVWINDGNGNYNYTGQALGNSSSWEVALGDLDGDGDLDAWVVNSGEDRVWINQGGALGSYSDSGQTLENFDSRDVSLGDLDGDGDLDAFSANGQGPNRMWINQGGVQGGIQGIYSDSGQSLGNSPSLGVALGDLDGDGDLDAWVANDNQPNRVWINDGFGSYTDSGQALGNSRSFDVALGDLDGDGDLDAWVANGINGNSRVWINQGNAQGGTPGIFATSGQALGNSTIKVSLGDIDGDGDLDAWLANTGQPNRVWLNDGLGNFTDSGQVLGGNYDSLDVALGDLDGDGDLDAWVANSGFSIEQPNRVWINQGGVQGGTPGTYADSGQELGSAMSQGVALGDLDGDGDLDAWVANQNNEPNRLWINQIPCYTDDIDGDSIPNECDIDQSAGEDCDSNGILDSCDIAGGATDADGNGIPDECEETPFIRGDFNGDGGVDIGDAIATLDYLFTGGSINCEDAADSNDDGAIDVADGIQILGYLFSGTGDLPNPFPTCGVDPTADTLECESYNGC